MSQCGSNTPLYKPDTDYVRKTNRATDKTIHKNKTQLHVN